MTEGNYNWAAIKQQFFRGKSIHQLHKLTGAARSSISARAKSEGWEADRESHAETVALVKDTPLLKNNKYNSLKKTPETVADIVRFLASGAPRKNAAAAAGISVPTLRSWIISDPAFGEMLEVAEASGSAKQAERIEQAGQRGDWRADAWLLKHSPRSREDYADANAAGSNGVSVTLQLFGRPDQEIVINGQTIDAE